MKEDGTFDLLTKKEAAKLDLEIEKLEKYMGGITEMKKQPLLCSSLTPARKESRLQKRRNSVFRLSRLSTPTATPMKSDYVIPGNDDAIRAVKLIAGAMADAVIEGRQGMQGAAAEEAQEEAPAEAAE